MPVEYPESIDVWRIDLATANDLEACFSMLDADEQARADRFRFSKHRRRFILAHAAVRGILAARLGVPPCALNFCRSAHGKPYLESADAPVFSLSHSHEMALLAVAAEGELGIDIEWCRDLAHAEMAQRFFAADEAAALAALPPDRQREGFFACWTCKEAYIKAKGLGLSLPLHAFSVAIDPQQAPQLLSSRHDPGDVGPYRFWEVPVAAGYRAALAYRGAAESPRYRDWTALC